MSLIEQMPLKRKNPFRTNNNFTVCLCPFIFVKFGESSPCGMVFYITFKSQVLLLLAQQQLGQIVDKKKGKRVTEIDYPYPLHQNYFLG